MCHAKVTEDVPHPDACIHGGNNKNEPSATDSPAAKATAKPDMQRSKTAVTVDEDGIYTPFKKIRVLKT